MNFHVSDTVPRGGPGIFGSRLMQEFIDQGDRFNGYLDAPDIDLNVSIIEGQRTANENAMNVLRLDGCYFDSALGVEKCFDQNFPLMQSIKRHDHVVFQSEHSKRLCNILGLHTDIDVPSSVIHNGVPEVFCPKEFEPLKDEKPYLIASASWRRHKRLEETVAAFADPRLADYNLVVLGGTEYKLESNPYFTDIPKNVLMLPSFSPHRLPSLYQTAIGMIHLCWLDSCPNSVVEALACGIPVLCSHNGGTKELVVDNGVVIQLEEDYEYGTMVDLYNPPVVDINTIVEGVLGVLEKPKGFARPDLSITTTAKNYKRLMSWV